MTAVAGWGVAGAWCLRAAAGVELRAPHEILALGVALVLAGAGVAVAFDAFRAPVVAVVLGAGTACALVELRRRIATGGRLRARAASLGTGAVVLGADFLVCRWTTAAYGWNGCDDDVAYLYLARRLVLRGDLLDPLDNRRLTSPGGMSALQALFLFRLPDSYLRLADLLVGSLLVLLALWRTRSGGWSPWGIAAALAVACFPVALGMINTSPLLLPCGLTIAAVLVAIRLRAEPATPRAEAATAVVLGLVVGAVATLRPDYDPPLGALALAACGWPPLSGLARRCVGLAAGGTVAIAGWSVASWRAVGTPLFPLLRGNLDPTWPANGPAVGPPSPWAAATRLAGDPSMQVWGLALVGAVCLAAHLVLRPGTDRASAHWSLRLVGAAAAVGAAWVLVLTIAWWGLGSPATWPRFWAPVLVACLLLPLVPLNGAPVRRPWAAAAAGSAALLLVLSPVVAEASPALVARTLVALAADTASGRTEARLATDRYARRRGDYDRAAAAIRPGSLVLAAVDVPSLLLADGLDLDSVDIVGSTSPSPHLPYFQGTAAKIRWLRAHGYRYVVAVEPTASVCLYARELNEEDLRGEHGQPAQAWAPYFIDWFGFLDDLSRMPGATRAGSLLVAPL